MSMSDIKAAIPAQAIKTACDVGSACAAIGAWAGALQGVLGAIASALSIAWFCWRFYRDWKDRHQQRNRRQSDQ